MFDAIVVGSGPAGVFAAYQLRPLKILLLDVGHDYQGEKLPEKNLYELRREPNNELSSRLLGQEFESLHNLERDYMSPKLKGPAWRFVTQRPRGLPSDLKDGFEPVMSFAKGGLANAWGAGVLRFDDRDLAGFPYQASALDRYYDELTAHIGINGSRDDLENYFGSIKNILPPMPLSPLSHDLMSRYSKKRQALFSTGFRVGRTRAAILTEARGSRPAYRCFAQDFFQPNSGSIYHPGYTLDDLVRKNEVEYRSGQLVERFIEQDGRVSVFAKNLKSGETEEFQARSLFLAAGAINSARIVLKSHDDVESRLPLLDNPVSFIPLINLRRIGDTLPIHSFAGGELIVLYEGPESREPIQASFYGLGAPLRTDLLTEFPLPFRGNLTATKYLLPALAMLQVFHPDEATPGNFVQLRGDGSLQLSYQQKKLGTLERLFIRAMRKLGFYSSVVLCKFPAPGASIHYAGTLPAVGASPGRYQTDRDGRLGTYRNVYVCDAANFPRLPSKNLTFTIMANSMRIAERAKQEIVR